jgi:hypothetical protein
MTFRMIADIVKNRLRDNLEMTVKEARGLVKQKFPTVQPSYNKLWRERELSIADKFGSWERSYKILPLLDGRNQQARLFTVIVLNTLHKMCIRTVI